MVAPVPAQTSKLPRRKLSCLSRRSTPNSCRLILLQTLLHSQSRQPLWNQANPNSFAKTPVVGVPRFSFRPPTAHYPPLTTHSLPMFGPFDHQAYRMSLLLVPSYFAELNRFCIPSPIVPVPPPSYTSTSLQEAFL